MMSLAFTLAFAPQIIKTLQTKDVSGVSTGVYWLSLLGYIAGILHTYLCIGFDLWLYLNFGLGLLLTVWFLWLHRRYQRPF